MPWLINKAGTVIKINLPAIGPISFAMAFTIIIMVAIYMMRARIHIFIKLITGREEKDPVIFLNLRIL